MSVSYSYRPASRAWARIVSVEGGGVIQIVGGFYLPTQFLNVGGGGMIGAISPYMPIISSQIVFHSNAMVSVSVDHKAAGYRDVLTDVRTGSPRHIN